MSGFFGKLFGKKSREDKKCKKETRKLEDQSGSSKETPKLEGQSGSSKEPPLLQYNYFQIVDQEKLNHNYSLIEYGIKKAFHEGAVNEGNSLIQQALNYFEKVHYMEGEAYALHFLGRIEHEKGNLDLAMSLYDQALKTALFINRKTIIARAMYERARIFMNRDYDFEQAEDGFRYALTYYAGERDEENLYLAIKKLWSLAQDALSSPEFFLPKLEQEGVPVGKPEDYLIVRCLAILAEVSVNHKQCRESLLKQAERILKEDPHLASYILDEVERTGELYNDVPVIDSVIEMRGLLTHF